MLYGRRQVSRSGLHQACSGGDLEMVLSRGAQIERRAIMVARSASVHYGQVGLVKYLLAKGADATAVVPLLVYVLMYGGRPLRAELLYVAMALRAPNCKPKHERS
jgi:hypothetical protein